MCGLSWCVALFRVFIWWSCREMSRGWGPRSHSSRRSSFVSWGEESTGQRHEKKMDMKLLFWSHNTEGIVCWWTTTFKNSASMEVLVKHQIRVCDDVFLISLQLKTCSQDWSNNWVQKVLETKSGLSLSKDLPRAQSTFFILLLFKVNFEQDNALGLNMRICRKSPVFWSIEANELNSVDKY